MTTDPRVIECAKALYDSTQAAVYARGWLIPGQRAAFDDLPQELKDEVAANALATILKWLEQVDPQGWMIPTPEGEAIMASRLDAYVAACRTSDCAERGFDEKDCGNCAFCADIGDNVIAAYCAQAAKEIAG